MTNDNKQRTEKHEEKLKDEKDKTAESTEEKTEEMPLLDEPIKVKDYVYLSLLSLEAKAWAYLDFVAHPETQKHKKDINEAKLAIDAMDVLFKTVEQHLSPEQKKDLQTRLTNLRLNFAKK
jgi:hypothetical protein